jgi:hypothetical protein
MIVVNCAVTVCEVPIVTLVEISVTFIILMLNVKYAF